MSQYEECRELSDERLRHIREDIKGLSATENDTVVVFGSYARREASCQSDMDYALISDEKHTDDIIGRVKSVIENEGVKAPAEDGHFGENATRRSDLLSNIGGEDDSNRSITHRILLLLEGDWLFNETGLHDLRRGILERYIGEQIADHQLALFLLNDIIRYYRTIAVDYEFKISGGEPKPWATRNIKLTFSRKLLYASGLFSVALTADRTRDRKIELLEELFDLPVIDRMVQICGRKEMKGVLDRYDVFLQKMAIDDVRGHLASLTYSQRKSDREFRELKNQGHAFTHELLKLFENTFHSTHPIRRAIIY